MHHSFWMKTLSTYTSRQSLYTFIASQNKNQIKFSNKQVVNHQFGKERRNNIIEMNRWSVNDFFLSEWPNFLSRVVFIFCMMYQFVNQSIRRSCCENAGKIEKLKKKENENLDRRLSSSYFYFHLACAIWQGKAFSVVSTTRLQDSV